MSNPEQPLPKELTGSEAIVYSMSAPGEEPIIQVVLLEAEPAQPNVFARIRQDFEDYRLTPKEAATMGLAGLVLISTGRAVYQKLRGDK